MVLDHHSIFPILWPGFDVVAFSMRSYSMGGAARFDAGWLHIHWINVCGEGFLAFPKTRWWSSCPVYCCAFSGSVVL